MAGPYYTTATIVRQTLKAIDVDLDDAEIGVYITQAESFVEAICKTQAFRTTFDAEKWGIIRRLSTNLTVMACLGYDVTEFATTSQGALTADIIWAMVDQDINFLSDDRVIEYLKGAS